ncbi:MAG: glycosyltransferase family A protein, partial [Candidatus Thorarchaeota archaeon]
IDDGSTDGTVDEIKRVSKDYPEIECWIEQMPQKVRGNMNRIGRAYSRFMPALVERLDDHAIDYVVVQDADTRPCPNYFARVISVMEQNLALGACAGFAVGEESAREAGLPMGGCKVTRWEIIERIDRYWDLAPDTFINIKTLKMGFALKILRVPVLADSPTYALSSRGVYRLGQRNFFVGRPFLGVFLRALRRVFLRRHGTQMLRGYLSEHKRGSWRSDDPDVLDFYGHGKSIAWVILELFKTRGRYSD